MSVKPSHPSRRAGLTCAEPRTLRRSRLAALLHGALFALAAGVCVSPPAAQAQAAAASAQAFNVAPGPLSTVLTQFARQADTNLAYDAASLEGLESRGLAGRYTVEQGLAALLAGTGIEALPSGDGYSLRRRPAAEAAMLSEIEVRASRSTLTEGSGSYTPAATATATKLPLSPRETPQTITVVTRQQMDDFGMTTVDAALKSVSGVYVWARGSNGNDYLSRGFQMQMQYDGILDPIGIGEWNRAAMADNAFIDHVEVLQGAAGLLSGAGEPGGVINMVRKRPTHEFQAHAEAQLGSWNQRRMVGDISGALLSSGAVRGRVVAVADNADSFIDHAYKHKRAAYGVLEADLGSTTTLRTSIQYQRDKGRNSLGVPMAADGSDLGLPRSSFFANAKNQSIKQDTLYTATLEQRLPANWQANATYTYRETNVDISRGSFLYGGVLDTATGDGLSLHQHRYLIRRFKSHAFDVHASGPFTLFGREHELVLGLNGVRLREASRNSGNVATPINIYDFEPYNLPDPAGVKGSLPDPSKTEQHGVFAVGRFSLTDKLKVITGVRASWYEARNAAGDVTQKEDGKISPYMGIVYDIGEHYSAYASYSDIFKPQTARSSDGSTLKPVVGANYEIGLKGEWLDGRLNASAALFRLEQTNLAEADLSIPPDPGNACGGTCYIAQGKIKSEGLDLGVNGEVAPGWQLAAGYTYARSKHAAGVQRGAPYRTDFPRHSVRLATQYKIPASGWSVGGSVTARSKIYRAGAGYRIEQSPVVLVDLNARYQVSPRAEVGLVVSNLFDKRYYDGLESLYYNQYGAPRAFSMNFRYQF